MKRIGLIGGLSWQSTVDYYRIINEESAKRLGGLNNVESIVYSVNLNEMLEHMGKGEVEILGGKFAAVGKKLEEAGADLISSAPTPCMPPVPSWRRASMCPLSTLPMPLPMRSSGWGSIRWA